MTDEEQIRQTLAHYGRSLDGRDVDGYVAVFAEQGRFVSSATGDYVGRPAVRAFIEELFARQAPGRRSKHTFSNSVIDVHGDTAEVVTDVVVYGCQDDSPWEVTMINRHIDRLVREDGSWLFSEKRTQRV